MKSSYFFLLLFLTATTFFGCKETTEEKKKKAIELISTQTMGLAFLEVFRIRPEAVLLAGGVGVVL
jgi:hypothetical protein